MDGGRRLQAEESVAAQVQVDRQVAVQYTAHELELDHGFIGEEPGTAVGTEGQAFVGRLIEVAGLFAGNKCEERHHQNGY